MSKPNEGRPDGNGYGVYFIFSKEDIELKVEGSSVALSHGDLVLVPAHPDRTIMSLYPYIKSAHSALTSKHLKSQVGQIKKGLKEGYFTEDTNRYSQILIADKVYGIKLMTIGSFLSKYA